MAFLNKGLEIVVRDERPETAELDAALAAELREGAVDAEGAAVVVEPSEDEVADSTEPGVVERRSASTGPGRLRRAPRPFQGAGPPSMIDFAAELTESGMSREIAMQWIGPTPSRCTPSPTPSTPTRAAPTRRASVRAHQPGQLLGPGVNLIKKPEDRVSGDDVREGLTAIISIKLGEPQFEGQTKTKLGNTEAKGFVQRVVNEELGDWFAKNPAEGRDIVRKAQAAAYARVAGEGARAARSARVSSAAGAGPGKLAELPVELNRGKRDLHRGRATPRRGRPGGGLFPAVQVILLIRGKILNVEEGLPGQGAGEERRVQAIIAGLGTGIEEQVRTSTRSATTRS